MAKRTETIVPAPIDPNHPYTKEVLRHQRFLEQRDAQDQAEEAERLREMASEDPDRRLRVAELEEAQRIMAELPAAEPVPNDTEPDLDSSWRVARRDGYDGPEWCGWVSVKRPGQEVYTHTTGWLPRARFFAECAVLRRHFNAVLFDGVGMPHVW